MNDSGSLDDLKALLACLDDVRPWQPMGDDEWAVIEDGVSHLRLNWWPSTGELTLIGDPAQRSPLLEQLQSAIP